MKALIISEDINFTSKLDSFFTERDFSTIIYKWLIKAMDNLEEIKPEIIIISADEYPRHWKTLVQFMNSGIAGKDYKIYLYKKGSFSEDELSKISTLSIKSIFSDFSDSSLETVFSDLFTYNKKEIIEQVESAESVENTSKELNDLVITNPGTHNFVFGKYCFINNNTLLFETSDFCSNLKVDEIINKITYCHEGKYISTSAKILELNNEDKIFKFKLQIME